MNNDWREWERVVSVEQLSELTDKGKTCYHVGHQRIYPARVLLNWQGREMLTAIKLGYIRIVPGEERN